MGLRDPRVSRLLSGMVDPLELFLSEMESALRKGEFVSLVVSKLTPVAKSESQSTLPLRQDVRPVTIAGDVKHQWTIRVGKQEHHENLDARESLERVRRLLHESYLEGHLRTTQSEIGLHSNRRGKRRLSNKATTRPAVDASHNRQKAYLIPEGTPCPFLEAIGVMTRDGQVRRQKEHKFRQINRYLELVADILPAFPAEGPLHVVDFGCGKSGLTFALYHLLTVIAGREARIVGLDWNAQVLEDCGAIARRLRFDGLTFQAGDIAQFELPAELAPVHLAVSLHACDTATDDAIAQGIGWGADVILSVPCCQHELSQELASPALGAVLRHGILRERFSALATDALRGAWLDAAGYRTQILEFIDMEHTPKNLLIRAVKSPGVSRFPVEKLEETAEIRELMSLLGVPEMALSRHLRRK